MSDTSLLTRSDYARICNSLPDPTFILSASGRYVGVLGGQDRRYYHDGTSLVGQYLSDVLVPAKAQWFLAQIREALATRQMLVVEYELSARDVLGLPPDGPENAIWFEGRISPLKYAVDGEPCVVWVASNITTSKRLQDQLMHHAMSDELTGLCNRRYFMQVLARAYVDYVGQTASAHLISMDVDGFKEINDVLGHIAGDQALRDLADALRQVSAPGDMVCRLGGDEFAILCLRQSERELTDFAGQLLDRGREALRPYATPNSTPSLSLGMAQFSEQDTSLEDIMRRADQALYRSKRQGGHRASMSEPAPAL